MIKALVFSSILAACAGMDDPPVDDSQVNDQSTAEIDSATTPTKIDPKYYHLDPRTVFSKDAPPDLACGPTARCAPYSCWVDPVGGGTAHCESNKFHGDLACQALCGWDAECPTDSVAAPEDIVWFCITFWQSFDTDPAIGLQKCIDANNAVRINCDKGQPV